MEVVQGAGQGSHGRSGVRVVEGGLRRQEEGVGDQRGGLDEPQGSHGRWHREQEAGGLKREL